MTKQSYSVSPFSASYEPMQDVLTYTCLTVYTYKYRRNWIIFFNEVLWFGTSMDSSIINTNQIGMTGIPFSDDYYDDNWKLGISHKNVLIPFRTGGTTVYFDSRVPT